MTLVTSLHCPAAEMITVPGASTSPSGYFCFMERESFPVGILIPRAIAKEEHSSTASYRRASSPGLLHGHIQLAERETLCSPCSNGAQTMLVKASAMAVLLPFFGSISALTGACPTEVAIPLLPV